MSQEPTTLSTADAPQGDVDEHEGRMARPRRAAPADAIRPTRAEVNLAALRQNLRAIERRLGPSRPEVWGVLKADAYGHGAPAVARTLERAGIAGLCVALLEEGIELREAGIRIPILVMGGYYGHHHRGLEEALARDLTPVVYHVDQVQHLSRWVRARGTHAAAVHLKIDTGMSRLGARPDEFEALIAAVASTPEVKMQGLMSHLACADGADVAPTRDQIEKFSSAVAATRRIGLEPGTLHMANSAGMLRFPAARFDAVRPGLALYGLSPLASDEIQRDLVPALRVRTEIVALRDIEAGEAVGYGHTFRATSRRRIATIPVGYADGFPRALSGKASVLVRGKRAPLAGIVSMDLAAVDVTDVPGAALGDEVVVLGAQEGPLGRDVVSADELASLTGAISWEILTHISRRVPRFYREP